MHWELLRAIALDPGHGPGFYAKRMGTTLGKAARATDRLEGMRYITRKPVPDRGNHTALELTAAGRKALADVVG